MFDIIRNARMTELDVILKFRNCDSAPEEASAHLHQDDFSKMADSCTCTPEIGKSMVYMDLCLKEGRTW